MRKFPTSAFIIASVLAQQAFAQSNDYQPGKSSIHFTDINSYSSPSSSSTSTSSSNSSSSKPSSKSLYAPATAVIKPAATKPGSNRGKRQFYSTPSIKPVSTASITPTSSPVSPTSVDSVSSTTTNATTPTASPIVTTASVKPTRSNYKSNSKSTVRAATKPVAATVSSSKTVDSASSTPTPPEKTEPPVQAAAESVPADTTSARAGKNVDLKGFGRGVGGVLRGIGGLTKAHPSMGMGGGWLGGTAAVVNGFREAANSTVISPNAAPLQNYSSPIPTEAQGGAITTSAATSVAGSVMPRQTKAKEEKEQGPPVDQNRPVTDKWAIVMGVGKFKDPSIPSLRYAAKDAQDFAKFLVEKQHFAPDHVRLLLNEKATRTEFLSEIGDKFFPRVVHPDDLVLLFFSSHGSPADKDIGGSNFVVAYDTEKANLYATGIEMQELTRILRERTPKASRVCILMDACHSGGGADGAKDAEDTNMAVNNIDMGHGQLLISSSSASERSWESKRYQNGVFTKNLMDALSKENGNIKLLDAITNVQKSIADEVQQDDATSQTVTKNDTKWSGKKLVLGSKPSNPQPLPDAVKKLLAPDSHGK